MSTDRLLSALIIGLLATSLGSSLAAFHFYQSGLEQLPGVSNLSDEIGALGIDVFQTNNATLDIDSLVEQLYALNSTEQQAK